MVTTIAPELLLAKAMQDLGSAQVDLTALQRIASEDGVPWSLTHSLFADMGGFVVTEGMPEVINEGKESMDPRPTGNGGISTTTHTGGVALQKKTVPTWDTSTEPVNATNLVDESYITRSSSLRPQEGALDTSPTPTSRLRDKPFYLAARCLIKLRQAGLLSRLPSVTLEEINDKSKMIRLQD